MSSGSEQRKLAAIMFTDMVGYSALSQRNEKLAQELLEEHRALLRPLFPRFNGTEIKTIGDAFLVEFHSALEAAQCSIEIQRALAKRNHDVPAERRIEIKIGIHIGDVVHRDGDVYGDGVNIASRIEPLAGAGGICVSMDVERQIRNALEARFEKLAPTELKNISVTMDLFRIVLPWEKQPDSAPTRRPSKTGVSRSRVLAAAAIVILLVLATVVLRLSKPASRASAIRSIAVKPLDYFGGDTNQTFLADGMTEALTRYLSDISALHVRSRSTVMTHKGRQETIKEFATAVDTDAVVEGSIQREGNRLRITVQLIEAATDRHLWATNYDRDMSDFFKVQSEVAQAIAQEIDVRLTPQDQTRLANAPSAKPEVIEAYLQGRWQLDRRTVSGFTNAIAHFERVIDLDSTYAPGYAGLASAYAMQPFFMSVPGTNAAVRAKLFAEKTLGFDPNSAEALSALGFVQMWADRNWAAAEASFKKAIKSNTSFAQAHFFYANLLARRGRFKEALDENQKAIVLEPNAEAFQMVHGLIYFWSGDRKRGIEITETAARLFPDFRLLTRSLAMVFVAQGDYARAITLLNVPGKEIDDLSHAFLGAAYAGAGQPEEARRILRRLQEAAVSRYVSPNAFMILHASLHEMDRAFEMLEAANRDRHPNVCGAAIQLDFIGLRGDPRFTEFLKREGLNIETPAR
ncbi:MAG: tetratricopeptide repeat protein [Verrucomicrobia bacterium]|nr:tetratricopeptide repeat protein [Verrucomicrobiota bacterium]